MKIDRKRSNRKEKIAGKQNVKNRSGTLDLSRMTGTKDGTL